MLSNSSLGVIAEIQPFIIETIGQRNTIIPYQSFKYTHGFPSSRKSSEKTTHQQLPRRNENPSFRSRPDLNGCGRGHG